MDPATEPAVPDISILHPEAEKEQPGSGPPSRPITPPSRSATPPRDLRRQSSGILNPIPQTAPGASSALGHTIDNSIPLSIFPIATDKFAFCMCGLPGRGKTHISRKIARYLSFFHAIPVKLFNVSEYRRSLCGSVHDAMWFDHSNVEAEAIRTKCNQQMVDDALAFLRENNGVAILDTANATVAKRARLVAQLRTSGAKIMFIEVQNSDEVFLSELYKQVAASSPDYEGVDSRQAELDYRQRVNKYQDIFEPLDTVPHSVAANTLRSNSGPPTFPDIHRAGNTESS